MQYTENYQFRKPVIGIDVADVKDINFNSDKLDALLHNTQISLAPAYDLNETYDTGDVVMYETLMYKCKEDNVTGAWEASKWERTTAGEEGSGGGGTSVIPNPQGEPTDTLNTIGIDGIIFDIAGSGGGGGTGGGLERTLLWDYVTDNNNVIPYGLYTETLHDDIDNYDFIVAEIVSASGDLSASGWEGTNLWTIDVNALNNTEVQNYLNYTSFGERSSRFYIKDTTFQKTTDNRPDTNGLVRVYGLKWTGGGSGASSEIIPISAGDGTNSRTFTFDKTPKKVTLQGYTSGDGGWYESGYFIWGENFINLIGAQYTVATGGYAGQASITYGADGKSFTITAANSFGAFNRADNFTGLMFVDYGGGGGSSGGYSETDLFVNTGSSNPSSIVMDDSIQNYDEIVFKVTRNAYGNTYKLQYRYLTSELELGDQIQCWCWGPNNEYFSYILTAFDTFSNMAQGNALLCTKIIGIKH